MTKDYWQKQVAGKQLFPDLAWSRPENKMHAGKLLIVGGNLHGFSAPALAFAEAEKAGIGVERVVLPDAIRKTVGSFMPEADFAPSTPSGSFASKSLDTWLEHAAWADGVLIAGDLGRNSETAIVLESFANKYSGQLTITKDAADYVLTNPMDVLNRQDTLLVVTFAQLQKLASNAKFSTALTFDMDFLRLVDALHEFTEKFSSHIIIKHLETVFVAVHGQVSTTKVGSDQLPWRVKTAAHASVWWLQHPAQPFEALTTSFAANS
jgi:NAD(P)H-hydrate repair Nnr-like enzyme with NAD(P)H-hydrate dehydratase domain